MSIFKFHIYTTGTSAEIITATVIGRGILFSRFCEGGSARDVRGFLNWGGGLEMAQGGREDKWVGEAQTLRRYFRSGVGVKTSLCG